MNRAIAKLRLGDITRFVSGGTPSKQVPRYWGGSTPWVSAKDMKSLHIDSSIDTLSDSGRDAASLVPRGTLLILVRGMTLFKSIPIGIASRELAINQDLKGLITNGAVSPEFLAYSLLAKESELLQMVEAAGHGTGRLDTDALKDVLVRVPSLPEQHQVASAIATWDTAIQKTEQLIAAKEQHHSTLIHRLITAPSKSESWRHSSIRDIADRVQRQGDGADYPLLTISSASGFVRQEDRYSRYMAGESAKTYTLLRAGEFSYNKGNSKRYEFGCVFQLQDYDAALVPNVYVSFKLHQSVCAAYMRHLFAADYLKPQLRALVKTGVRNNGLLNIRPDEFMGTTVPLPPPKEQARIAKVLDAASSEIDLLRKQLVALRVQKRGLMQKLLTGKWRLPLAEEVSA